MFVEPFITLAKADTVANRRLAMARLGSKDAVRGVEASHQGPIAHRAQAFATFSNAHDALSMVAATAAVRRQNIWRNARRRLAECRPCLGVDNWLRTCGAAKLSWAKSNGADVRWFVAKSFRAIL